MTGKKFLALAAIFLMGFLTACAKKEPPAQDTQNTRAALRPESQKLMALLPDDGSIPGWTREPEVRFFVPDDLFEFINGASENYLIYGFEEVVTAEYGNPDKSSQVVVEIYRMKDARNAFGIYASELNPDSQFNQIGAEGYIGGTALNFWSGRYYTKLTVFEESDDLKQEMMKFAQELSEKMGAPGELPAEMRWFPEKDLVPHSVRYLPRDVLGQAYLKEGFEAKYRRGGSETKLVVTTPGDTESAKEALARYRQFTAGSGEVTRDLTSPADGGFVGKDSYYGHMAAIRSGNRIIVALGGSSQDYVLSQATSYLKNTSR
ncbi:MAG: hypothetical protein GXX84_08740 [Acidobacteria bacterium]|nr:hypothetical protein [Acidobacteriota bacterium]